MRPATSSARLAVVTRSCSAAIPTRATSRCQSWPGSCTCTRRRSGSPRARRPSSSAPAMRSAAGRGPRWPPWAARPGCGRSPPAPGGASSEPVGERRGDDGGPSPGRRAPAAAGAVAARHRPRPARTRRGLAAAALDRPARALLDRRGPQRRDRLAPVRRRARAVAPDGSPPLYYLLLTVWVDLFGVGEAHTHMLSLLFALATIPVAFFAGRSLFGVRAAWVAALLAAINPYLTFYAQETRMYALVVLLATFVAWAFGEAYVRRRRGWVAVFGVALALLAYTHNWGLFLAVGTVAALAPLVAAATDRRALLRDAAIGYGIAALLYAPWLPTLAFQARHTGAPWSQAPHLNALQSGMSSLLGGSAPAMAFALGAGSGFVALVAGWWAAKREPKAAAAIAIFVMGFVALALAWTSSQVSPA